MQINDAHTSWKDTRGTHTPTCRRSRNRTDRHGPPRRQHPRTHHRHPRGHKRPLPPTHPRHRPLGGRRGRNLAPRPNTTGLHEHPRRRRHPLHRTRRHHHRPHPPRPHHVPMDRRRTHRPLPGRTTTTPPRRAPPHKARIPSLPRALRRLHPLGIPAHSPTRRRHHHRTPRARHIHHRRRRHTRRHHP